MRLIGVLPHLDRPFEYAVTPAAKDAAPGMRVRVKFAGHDTDGIVLERRDQPSTDRPLAPLQKLVSDDVVVPPAMMRVIEEVAERYGGTVGDVLRLALPPRHARAEKNDRADAEKTADPAQQGAAEPAQQDAAEPAQQDAAETHTPDTHRPGDRYTGLAALIDRAGRPDSPVPRAAITLDPVDPWTVVAADAIADLGPERGALVIAPDQRDVQRLSTTLRERGIAHEVLSSSDGPEKRYRAFRRILRGASCVVLGNRSAAFAPVQNLALAICYDEADDLLIEPRAPYPHLRIVLEARSKHERCALLFLAHSDSVPVRTLAASGYLFRLPPRPLPTSSVRPRVVLMDDYLREREGGSGRSRLPLEATRLMRRGLQRGPVLVQVPRSGYVPAVACTFCGTRAICPTCSAPLSLTSPHALGCRVCGRREDAFRCPECHRSQMRAVVVGSVRTAEELRRALPDAELRVAGGAQGPLPDEEVPENGVVVATPGAEPAPPGGYAAAVLLDADAMLARASYDADVEAFRRWSNAIALVRAADQGGEVLVVGTSTLPAIRALVMNRPESFLDRVLEDRKELDLPPFTRAAEISGDRESVAAFLPMLQLPDATSVFGPVGSDLPGEENVARAVVRIEAGRSAELASALRAGVAARSARKMPGSVRVRLDPPGLF